jgi:hypothetical protein
MHDVTEMLSAGFQLLQYEGTIKLSMFRPGILKPSVDICVAAQEEKTKRTGRGGDTVGRQHRPNRLVGRSWCKT